MAGRCALKGSHLRRFLVASANRDLCPLSFILQKTTTSASSHSVWSTKTLPSTGDYRFRLRPGYPVEPLCPEFALQANIEVVRCRASSSGRGTEAGHSSDGPESAGTVCWWHCTTGAKAGQSNRIAGRTQRRKGASLKFAGFRRLCSACACRAASKAMGSITYQGHLSCAFSAAHGIMRSI
jgi:hypothetical protein